jgi:tetratricopeptide (TPR) repeat protein
MGTLMSVARGVWMKGAMVAGCLGMALAPSLAQNGLAQNSPAQKASGAPQHNPTVVSAEATRAILVEKGHALESRGRPDMAIQLWQQILLSDPNNLQALQGMARDLKLVGSDQAPAALDRLRRANPNDPNIAKIEALASTRTENDQLRQAGELARQGNADEAMRIYRQLYGDRPPDGDIALAYYQTLYGTANGKQEAIAAMRALAARNPGDGRYSLQLAILLTYDQKTRGEGIRLLKQHSQEASAQAALRQALIWDSANPASAAELRAYWKLHPQDVEVANHLKENETKLAQMHAGIARTPAEQAAFAALSAHRVDDADKRFAELLQRDPKNARAAAGMGFVRMQQGNFAAAIGYLGQAEAEGYKAREVEDALATSRFWAVMGEAAQAVDENQFDAAAAKYQRALAMRPRAPEALNGLAGLLAKEQQYAASASVYEQLAAIEPASADAWRGLFLAYARDHQDAKALAVEARFPASVAAALDKDPEYLRTLVTLYQAENRDADAQRALTVALALPFANDGSTLKAATKLEYAGILMLAKRYDPAAALYMQVLAEDAGDLQAWMGLVDAHHALGADAQAIGDVQKMPPATYQAALTDAGFLSALAAIYQQAKQLDVAQGLLERSIQVQVDAGKQPSISLQLQLADVYMARNNTDRAFAIYRRVLSSHPDRADAWKSLIAALQATHRDDEALQELAQIPAAPRKLLDEDIEFEQTVADLYAAAGDRARASEAMRRVEAHYAKLHMEAPANVAIQNCWLLFNLQSDRMLYQALMRLGGRGDLTIAQRETVEDIWAEWSVRRAAAAMENGNAQRAVDLLDAAAQAFPGNVTVRKAVAGGYAQVGRAKEALALYRSVPMQDATAGDLAGAIGAALGANDKNQAEAWLRLALERFPADSGVLSTAARYEQARGDNQRAAAYYRAALAAMPSASPAQRLAHELVYPEQDTRTHRAATGADLRQLLDPDNEPFPKTTKLPAIPAYGADPYNGAAPVVLRPSQPAPPSSTQDSSGQDLPLPRASGASRGAAASNPAFVPQAWTRSGTRSRWGGGPQSDWQSANRAAGGYGLSRSRADEGLRVIAGTFQVDRRSRLPMGGGTGMAGYFHAAAYVADGAASPRAQAGAAQHSAVEVQQGTLGDAHIAPQPLSPVVQLSIDPPHSAAADTWKGLISSLMAANRNAEALDELNKIPGDVRAQLEADIEFEQGVASLYYAVGDLPRATAYLNRVQDFYLLRRAPVPAGLEVQHAWLLYNVGDDHGLYPVLTHLDARNDLSADLRGQLDTIWSNWAVRRAETLMNSGAIERGVELLQAAEQDYPENMVIRSAVARAYARTGRPEDALALFKTIPLQNGTSVDYQGAISAALGVTDMAQAEAWLRQALGKFPHDAQILALAARFEGSRGNRARAADFWRASLAAMPADSVAARLDGGLVAHGVYAPPGPGKTKLLLDPQDEPAHGLAPPPLPAYPSAGNPSASGVSASPRSALQPEIPPDQIPPGPWAHAPSAIPLPLPDDLPPGNALASGPASHGQPPGWDAAQTRLAEQTDGQLTQNTPSAIHNLANAGFGAPSQGTSSGPANAQLNGAQYTPSAQEAATGAYSAPRQQPAQQASPTPGQPCAASPCAVVPAKPKAKKKKRNAATTAETPSLDRVPEPPVGNATQASPTAPSLPPLDTQAPPAPAEAAAPASDAGLSDEELQQRNLPPLRGPWIRTQRNGNPISPREEAEMQLRSIESGYSGWLAGTGLINYRGGDLGYDHLAALEGPFEFSAPLGYNGRFTIVAKPVFLDSGQADGTSTLMVQEQTTAGTSLVSIPQPIGTATNTALAPPAQQNAAGVGGELQLAFPHLALAAGYTPAGFLVGTITGRAQWRPGNGPVTLNLSRDSVRDTQLSYAGLRDPAGDTLGNVGQIWGGVVANQGGIQFSRGSAESGFYIGGGGQYLSGYHVETNRRFDGVGGAYWRIATVPEYGNLSIGINFFGMHYSHNEDAFTHGMGGYFSPQAYLLANVPFTWAAHYGTRWHYNAVGSLGVQAFQQDLTPLWPLAVDKALETSMDNAMLPAKTNVGPNYDVRGQASYLLGPHWFAGGFFSANNARNYTSVSAGFSIHYMFRAQPATAATPTGIFPTEGLRPFAVP